MRLLPAVKIEDQVIVGDPRDSHDTIIEKHGLRGSPVRGFSPSTNGIPFLSRKAALTWLAKYEPEIYKKVLKVVPEDGLHSEDYAAAKGIKQRELVYNLSKRSICVFDISGMYTYIAERLARDFGKVFYYVPNSEDAYLLADRDEIGTGIEGITRIYDFWPLVDSSKAVDAFYFPDVGYGSLQCHLEKIGIPTGGAKKSEILEVDKWKLLESLEKVGLPVPKTARIVGFERLKEYLKDKTDKWLKVGWKHRGIFETHHHVDWATTEEWYYKTCAKIGKHRDNMVILVQNPVPSQGEVAIDGWRIGASMLPGMVTGIELKDMGLAGMVVDEMPQVIAEVENKLAPEWERLGYNGAYGNEIRLGENGKYYYIDATCRVGRPPGEIHTVVFNNYSQIVWAVCNGKFIEPKWEDKYVAHVMLTSPLVMTEWLKVSFPEEIKNNVMLANYCRKKGDYWCIPDGSGETDVVGAAIGIGKTMADACKQALAIAAQVEAEKIEYKNNLFDEIQKSIDAVKKFGINYD